MWVCCLDPAQTQGAQGGRVGPNEESEPSDDDMLSLSSQQSGGSGEKAKGAGKAEAQPAAPSRPPAEDVDLLGLDGGDIQPPPSSPQPPTTTNTTTDLLGDLFGGPGSQLSSGPTSAQSTPKRTTSSTSPCPSPRQTGSKQTLLKLSGKPFTGFRSL